ncbi:MAG: RNA polymerase sigma factor [Myxococcota bacterium]|nr:RNA polymerase sigma factor [Myxococcota bacterium]
MERIQAGDTAAYRQLFQRYRAPLYGFLVRRVGDREVAGDLFQETFLRVHRASGTWRRGRPVRPWLYSIATNAARDHARRGSRRIEETGEIVTAGPRDTPEVRMTLEACIAALPDNLREAFLLGVVEGFDHNEVAEQLEISTSNARARVCRARLKLREMLEET